MDLRSIIREIKDFPKDGIVFLDITPILGDAKAFKASIDQMAELFSGTKATKIMAAEARGFIFGAPLAYTMGLGFVPVRKPGKLPYKTTSVTYDLEYGADTLCMHEDALQAGEKVLLIDDVIATGGTMNGMIKLVNLAGAEVDQIGFLIEIEFLKGSEKLENLPYKTLIKS